MKIETANIKCEFCDSVFDSSYDTSYDARIENLVKPYTKDLIRIYNETSCGKDENKFIQLDFNLTKKYSNRIKKYEMERDYICKNCNRFSANLYNFLKSVKFRLKTIRESNRRKEGIRLEYFGIIFDSKFQLYSSSNSDRKYQNELDYICGRYLYEKSYDHIIFKEKYFFSKNYLPWDEIWYEISETFSFDYKKLTFIFTGKFTDEIKEWLTKRTIDFIEKLISLEIIKLEKFFSNIINKSEVEKFISYIQILDDIFLFSFVIKSIEINQIFDKLFQKITFH